MCNVYIQSCPPSPPPGWARALPRWDDGHVLNHWSAAVGCTRLTAIEMTQHPLMQSVVLSLSTIGQTAENLYAKTHSVCVQVTIQRVCMRAYAELFALGRCAHWPRGSSILVRVTCGSRVHHWPHVKQAHTSENDTSVMSPRAQPQPNACCMGPNNSSLAATQGSLHF